MRLHKSYMTEQIYSNINKETKEPPMYKVLLHNDDYTTMKFVVEILLYVFKKSVEDATAIMLKVHKEGVSLCGIFTYEGAETKVNLLHKLSKERAFPLKSSIEREYKHD